MSKYKKAYKLLKKNINIATASINLSLEVLKDYDGRFNEMNDIMNIIHDECGMERFELDAFQSALVNYNFYLKEICNILKDENIYSYKHKDFNDIHSYETAKSKTFKHCLKEIINIKNQLFDRDYIKKIMSKTILFSQTFFCIEHILFDIEMFIEDFYYEYDEEELGEIVASIEHNFRIMDGNTIYE